MPQDWVEFNKLRGLSTDEQTKASGRGTTEFFRSRITFISESAASAGTDIFHVLAVSYYCRHVCLCQGARALGVVLDIIETYEEDPANTVVWP